MSESAKESGRYRSWVRAPLLDDINEGEAAGGGQGAVGQAAGPRGHGLQ
jgi:hypothetical protein